MKQEQVQPETTFNNNNNIINNNGNFKGQNTGGGVMMNQLPPYANQLPPMRQPFYEGGGGGHMAPGGNGPAMLDPWSSPGGHYRPPLMDMCREMMDPMQMGGGMPCSPMCNCRSGPGGPKFLNHHPAHRGGYGPPRPYYFGHNDKLQHLRGQHPPRSVYLNRQTGMLVDPSWPGFMSPAAGRYPYPPRSAYPAADFYGGTAGPELGKGGSGPASSESPQLRARLSGQLAPPPPAYVHQASHSAPSRMDNDQTGFRTATEFSQV